MPPLAGKGKGKMSRDPRHQSRSRNTTPSSVLSGGTGPSPVIPPSATYLDPEANKVMAPDILYAEVVERLSSNATVPDPRYLERLVTQLRALGEHAEARVLSCDAALRELVIRRRDVAEAQREQERIEREAEQRRARLKKEAEEEEDDIRAKAGKLKKRKDRSAAREEQENRPLTHGAHGLARQDGLEIKSEDGSEKPLARSPRTPGLVLDSPSPSKRAKLSPGSSSLSEMPQSPEPGPDMESQHSPAKSPASGDSPMDEHQPEPAAPVVSQAFFPDPLAPDPIVYHIRDVQPGMIDEDKKEIYSVRAFPTKDLSDQMAGIPPDKDFSNAKPSTQVNFNTFLSSIDPYTRLLTEEDIAFLKERGDRATPFLQIPRGKKHYSKIWAEEDGLSPPNSPELDPNQPRGNIEEINDDTAATDQISTGPLTSRLLSLLRFEHRPDSGETNGNLPNGHSSADLNGTLNGDMDLDLPNGVTDLGDKPLPPSTAVAESAPSSKAQPNKQSYHETEDRLKLELRHVGLLAPDENPDFEGHHDDDISERLRLLQGELKRVMIMNGARKARLLDIARERLAFQEYTTIHEDLDNQVQQAYLKRTRTLGKSKKGQYSKQRPGGAGGGSHIAAGAAGGMGAKRDIGDMARMLMDRRRRWQESIGPVFEGVDGKVPGKDTSLWDETVMTKYDKLEIEGLEEETE